MEILVTCTKGINPQW
uniref:Uncharacterized protein n=1 Tax=Arundo donax TaxID=35708 RepID=A0A0A8ZJT7_ARUDO